MTTRAQQIAQIDAEAAAMAHASHLYAEHPDRCGHCYFEREEQQDPRPESALTGEPLPGARSSHGQ